jgi:lycopene cyclase-like protein
MMTGVFDIVVLGSGPAGLSIAEATAARGASLAIVAPEPHADWKPNYCLWADELPKAWTGLVERHWPRARVATAFGARALDRSYVKLDTARLQSMLLGALRRRGARFVAGAATELEHDAEQTLVWLRDGNTVRARVVIDASGARSRFVRRRHGRVPALQVAHGALIHAPGHPFDPAEAVLMDFRPASPRLGEPPSFLYALPLDEDRVFVEETSLAHRSGVDIAKLRARLETRLTALGLQDSEVLAEEHCVIPMGLGLPLARQQVLPFGAAASMVHPASGYLMSQIARKADPVALALMDALETAGPQDAINTAMSTLWPRDQRKSWELYGFGLESLVSMSTTETARFFDAFFRLPTEAWSGYLAGTLSPSDLGSVMTRLFRSLPLSLRWRMVRSSVSSGLAPLARSILHPGTA